MDCPSADCRRAYALSGGETMFIENKILIGRSGEEKVFIYPQMANRHGMIAGATGTGKTITLKVLAESFSDCGVPVFLADVKGDLAGMCLEGENSENIRSRVEKLGLSELGFSLKKYPVNFFDIYGEKGMPLRTTVSEMGPLLLSRILDLNDTQTDILTVIFKIADDQELFRQSLSIILKSEKDFEVTEAVSTGVEVVRSVRSNKPDVILMDIRMPEMDGVVCTQIIKENYPDIRIIILTTFDDDEYIFNALKYGASGYLLKGVSMQVLSDAIRKVYEGTAMINGDIASKVVRLFSRMAQSNIAIAVEEKDAGDLKDTEWKIISLVGTGLSNKEIAGKLNLSEGTVRNALSTVLQKLQLRDRTQLAIWAVQTGAAGREFE